MLNFKNYLTEAYENKKQGDQYILYVSRAVFEEMMFLEADTISPGSPPEKADLADAMTQSKALRKKHKLVLDKRTFEYVRDQFLPHALDIAEDQRDGGKISALRAFKRKIFNL